MDLEPYHNIPLLDARTHRAFPPAEGVVETYTAIDGVERTRLRFDWIVEAIPLDEIKAARKAVATERRKTERDRGVVINGNRWHSDKGSADDIATAVAMARLYEAGQGEGAFRTAWKTADGFVTATLSDLLAAGLAVGGFVQACFANEAALFGQIDAAETAEDVIAISLDDGWPDDGGPKDAATIQAIQQANARLERRAKELEEQGDITNAQLLRLSIKEI